MISTNLNTIPEEIITLIISYVVYHPSENDKYKEEMIQQSNLDLLSCSRISPSFTIPSQRILWSSLNFDEEEQVLQFIDSPATITGNYATRELKLVGRMILDYSIIIRLFHKLNQRKGFQDRLEALNLYLSNSIPISTFQNIKLTGLKLLHLSSPVRSNDSDSLELPFQLENLLLDGYLRKTNKFVAQLLTPSFNSLICRSGMPGLNLSSNIPLATSLKILDISAHDLEIIYLPLFPSIKTLSVRVFVEEDELIHLSSIFESFPVGSITRLKLNLDLVLIEEVDIVEADPILSRLIDIMNCPSLALLESLEIIHDGWIREDKGKEMSTEWEKRGISTVISILMDDEDCEEE